MKLSRIFSDLNKDVKLINMTHSSQFPPRVEIALHDKGWESMPVLRNVSYATFHGNLGLSYQSKYFLRKNEYQGSRDWYADLAGIVYPNHQPGILTKIIG